MNEENDDASTIMMMPDEDDNNNDDNNNNSNQHTLQHLPLWLQRFPYDTCISSNEPTPLELVREHLPIVLSQTMATTTLGFVVDQDRLKTFVQHILIESTHIRETKSTQLLPCNNYSLKEIQVQIMLRLELYSLVKESFLRHYALFVETSLHKQIKSMAVDDDDDKQRKANRRRLRQYLRQCKAMSPRQLLVHEVVELLSLVVFRLEVNVPFSLYCRQCLPQHLFTRIPAILQEVFDWFEIQNPWDDNNNKREAMSQVYIMSPMKQQQQLPSKRRLTSTSTTNLSQDDASSQATDETSLHGLPDRTSSNSSRNATDAQGPLPNNNNNNNNNRNKDNSTFTMKRRITNSLLKDSGKPRLLTSHFNTKLLGPTLFHQVQVVKTTALPSQPKSRSVSTATTSTNNNNVKNNNNDKSLRHRHHHHHNNNTTTTSKRKLLAPHQSNHNASLPAPIVPPKRSKLERAVVSQLPISSSSTSGAGPVKNEAGGGGRQLCVVYETPPKFKCTSFRRHSRASSSLGASNCIVQETPPKTDDAVAIIKRVQNKTTTTASTTTVTNAASPFWDRDQLLAEASQVLRRTPRRLF